MKPLRHQRRPACRRATGPRHPRPWSIVRRLPGAPVHAPPSAPPGERPLHGWTERSGLALGALVSDVAGILERSCARSLSALPVSAPRSPEEKGLVARVLREDAARRTRLTQGEMAPASTLLRRALAGFCPCCAGPRRTK